MANYITVQCCPCGCVLQMSEEEAVRLGEQEQLDAINAGIKVDALIISSSDCPQCEADQEYRDLRDAQFYADWPDPDEVKQAEIERLERALGLKE